MAHVLVEKIRIFAKPDLKWRKPSSRGWLALAFVTLAFIGVIVFFTPMVLGWKLIGGISMEPTMSWRSYVLLETIVEPVRELEVGDIVCVDNAVIGKSSKRVIEISSERGVYVVGDNKAVTSLDSSYGPSGQEVWIPFSDVRYRVKDVLTLRRLWRACTQKGKFQNWLELHEPMWAAKPAQNGYLIFELSLGDHGNAVDVVKVGEHRRQRVKGKYVDLLKPQTLVYRDDESLHEMNLSTGATLSRPSSPPRLRLPWTGKAVARESRLFGDLLVVSGSFPRGCSVEVNGNGRTMKFTLQREEAWDPVLKAPVTMAFIPRGSITTYGEVEIKILSPS